MRWRVVIPDEVLVMMLLYQVDIFAVGGWSRVTVAVGRLADGGLVVWLDAVRM